MYYSYKTPFLFLLTVFLSIPSLHAQTLNEQKLKMIFISQFTTHITWENEKKLDKFSIGIYGSDEELEEEMKFFAKSKKIKNRPVEILHFWKLNDIKKTQILFVCKDERDNVEKILAKLDGNNTLLITDSCDQKNFVMINLFLKDHKMLFEMNKANIVVAGLQYSLDILLLGGTELEVTQLFKQAEKSLSVEKEKVKSQQDEITTQQLQMEKQKNQILLQQEEIKKQEIKVEEQKTELGKLMDEIKTKQLIMDEKSQLLENQLLSIKKQEDKEKDLNSKILGLNNTLMERYQILKKQEENIKYQQERINQQKQVLSTQSSKIETQETIIYLSILFIAVVLIMLFFIFRANRHIKHTNQLLANEKAKVEQTLKDLKSAQTQLVNSEKMVSLGQLTAGIAHEINNPVNYISGGIVSLKANFEDMLTIIRAYEKLSPDNISHQLSEISNLRKKLDYEALIDEIGLLTNSIKKGAEHTAEIVKGLRTFARLDEDALKMTNVHENIDSTLIILHNSFKERIEIIKNYGDIPQIECYPGKLNQVYMNIINNAIQAIEGKGKIFITTGYSKKQVTKHITISIRDTGSGMSDRTKSKLFEPFFTTKDVGKGTGLGLSISLGIIKDHKGTIEVESTEGLGTEFIISLPVLQKG